MCYLNPPPDINLINNENFQSNVLLLPKTESTIFFISLLIFNFVDAIFVHVGLGVLPFLGKEGLGQLYHNLYFLCVIC